MAYTISEYKIATLVDDEKKSLSILANGGNRVLFAIQKSNDDALKTSIEIPNSKIKEIIAFLETQLD